MKRSAFKRAPPPASRARSRQWEGGAIRPRPIAVALVDLDDESIVVSLPKEDAQQHRGYMALVRLLPCARCGTLAAPRDFCHADEGKGGMLKTDCRRGWPGCRVCHDYVGASGRMGKAGRREFETFAGACTRAAIVAADQWPATLPRWIE